jgi:hypothetical protein
MEGEGDSAALLVAEVEAAFPLAAPGAVFFVLAIACLIHGIRSNGDGGK